MRRKFLLNIIVGLTLVFLVACQQNNLEEAEVQEMPSSKDGIQIKTEKDTYTQDTVKIVLVITNESNEELNSTFFELEKKVEGQWHKFPVKESGPIDAVGGYQPPNSTSEIVFLTDKLKYDLSPGSYRANFAGMATEFRVVE